MKRAVSALCVLALSLGLTMPAFADSRQIAITEPTEVEAPEAEPQEQVPVRREVSEQELQSRIADIQDTYGLRVTYKKSVKDYVPEYLDDLEAALKYVGPVFTKRISNYYKGKSGSFTVEIVPFPQQYANQSWIDALFTYSDGRGFNYKISLFVKPVKGLKVATIVHEFGHALHDCIGYTGFSRLNGGTKSYGSTGDTLDTNRYVTRYATNNHYEDFAETFMVMVMHNESAKENYESLATNTPLYKKYRYVHSAMEDFLGNNSRATKSAANFLNLAESTSRRD